MEFLIAIISISIIIAFIIWQFKVIMKYSFKFDSISIDEKNKFLTLNKEKIWFKDINHIEVNELQQPEIYEKLLSKGAAYNYMTEIFIFLKNNEIKTCKFNYKAILYKTLKRLQPYIVINTDIEEYKQESLPNLLSVLLLVIGCVIIFKLMF